MEVVAQDISNADAVITRNAGLNRLAMSQATKLKVIGNHGTGLDPIDLDYANQLGIPVVYTPHANAHSVAELTISLILALAKQLRLADQASRAGDFQFKYSASIQELTGKTLGIIGFGRIGGKVATILKEAFQMKVLAYAPTKSEEAIRALGGSKVSSVAELLSKADVVSVHLPLTHSTRHLIGAKELALMKATAFLVNTARGAIVNERALIEALSTRRIAGAALDVYESEDMPQDYALLQLDNLILTPHIGGSSIEALQRTALQVAEQVIDVLHGKYPQHLVNTQVWANRRS